LIIYVNAFRLFISECSTKYEDAFTSGRWSTGGVVAVKVIKSCQRSVLSAAEVQTGMRVVCRAQ